MEKLTSERPNFRPNEIALLRKVFGDEIADAAAKRSARVTAQDLSQAVNDPGVVQGLGHERIEFPGEGRLRGSPEGRQGELTLGGKPSDSPDFVPPPPGGFKTEPLYPEGIPAPKGYTGGVEAKPATGPVTRSPEELVLQSPGYQVGDIKQPAGRLATRSAPSGPISGPMSEQARAQLRQARLNEARRRRLAIQAAAVADEPYQFNLLNEVLGILGLSRSIMATADVSAIGRQAQILGWSNPREWRNAATAGVKAFASQEAADIADDAIRASPWYSIDGGARKGFGFLDVGGKLYEYGGRVKDPGERVPGFTGINNSWFGRTSGKFAPIRASERAHATILNVQGMQVYEKMADAMWNAGIRDRKRYEALAQVINHARGYGRVNIGQIIHGFDVFFSGRLLSSRFDILLDPLLYARQPEARNLALRNLAAFASGQAALMGFLGVTGAMAGGLWSVNADPRSGDFGKLRIGNTTIDLSAGIAPLVRTFTRIGAEGVAALGGPDYTRWQDNWRSTLVGFFRNKEAPWPALATDIIANEDPTGKTVDLSAEGLAGRLIEMHVPFIASSVYESFDQNTGDPLSKSTIATIGAIAEVFGGGTQTYRRLGEERQQALETEALPSLIEARVLPPDATLDNLGSGEYDAAVRWLRQHNPELLDAFEADRRSRNSLFQRIQDRRDVIDREYGAAFDRAYNDLLQGTRKPEEIRETLKGLRSEYAGRLEELYSDPEYRKQVESLEKNDIRKLEDDWYRITEDVAAGRKFPELTSDDWDEIDRRQQAFLDRLPNSTRARFERNLELRDSVADAHPLLKLKREVDEASVEYYELPEAQRDAWLRSHPQENVARWVMYGNQLRSSEAVNLVLSRQAPGLVGDALQQIGPREVKHERLARPINENDGSLAAWQYSQRALDFYFNDAITVFGDREAQRLYKKPFSQITPAQQASVRNIINTNIREANPELDAWLNWWGATETLQTVNAANILRQIVQRYGGTPPKEGHQPRLAADAR